MKRFKQSVGHAWRGIAKVYKQERNFRLHCFAALAIIIVGLILGFGALKWSLIALAIGIVMALEITNTAIEYTWNHLEPNHHPVVGAIKDIMAGAVLIASLAALAVGIFVIFFI